MANPIKSSDLFIDDGSLDIFIKKAKELETAVDSLRKVATALEAQIRKNNSTTAEEAEALKKTAKEADRIGTAYKKYNAAIDVNAKQVERIKEATREQNRLNKNTVKLADSAAGSYNALSAQYSINKTRLNAMSASQRKATQEGQQLEKQTREIYEEMKVLQAQTGKNTLDVGNYGKAINNLWQSFKNLFAVYLSFTGLQDLFSSVFGTTNELDALDLAYQKVISSSTELAQTNDFLAGVSDRLGLNILDVRKAYLKFRAAAGSTNLSVKQTQSIFESFSKASSILSLSADETQGIFKALEQIISKGKVSSEELRQQLGERLPGAMQIMAKSLGVSSSELDRMLKAGEVLSEDALPKFAKEVERAFGVENLKRVDTLAAAQNRFSSSFVELVDTLDSAGVFGTVINFFTSLVVAIRENLGLITNLAKGVTVAAAAFATYRTGIILSTAAQRLGIASTIADVTVKGLFTTATNLAAAATKRFTAALRANPYTFVATAIVGVLGALIAFNKEATSSTQILEDISNRAADATARERNQAELLIKVIKSENSTRGQKISALNELKQINADYFGDLELEKDKVEGLEGAYDKYIESVLSSARTKEFFDELTTIDKKLRETDLALEKVKRQSERDEKRKGVGRLAQEDFSGVRNRSDTRILEERKKELQLQKDFYFEKIKIEKSSFDESATATEKGENEITDKEKAAIEKRRKAAEKAAKDKERAIFDARKRQIDILEDGEEKELQTLQLSLDQKLGVFGKNGEATEALVEYYENRKVEVRKKYADAEAVQILDDEKERLDLMADGLEKELLLLENAKQRKLLTSKNSEAVTEQYARKETEIKRKYQEIENKETERILKAEYDAELKSFDQKEDLLKSEFDLLKSSEDEKTKFLLEAEKRRLKKLLELKLKYDPNLTPEQIQTLKNQIAGIDQAIGAIGSDTGKKFESFYDLLGINIGDEEKQAIATATSYAIGQVQAFQQKRAEIAEQNVQTANTEVATAQRTLAAEIANRNAGFAHNVETAQKEFDEAKKNQERAIKEREKAVKQQQRLDTISQTTSLITAAAGIWKSVGSTNPFLAIPLIALMFGSFAAAKIKANNLTKKTLGKGGYETIGGGSHQSGNDTFVGQNAAGEQVYAERGETMGVFKRKSVRRYGSRIKDLVNAVNSGTLDKHLAGMNRATDGIPVFNFANGNNTDMTTTETELRRIRQQGEKQIGVNQQGQRFEKYKNILTTYVQ